LAQNTGGFYKCNRFDAIKTDGSSSAAQKAKAELERYLHYYQRFHGHDSALKFAAGQREAAERRMVERQEAHRSTWIDVQFLKHAAEQVIDCRRVLKYSYALGYFLENESLEKQLFEHHQELLEKNTEKLHEYTEQSLDVIDRTQVRYRICYAIVFKLNFYIYFRVMNTVILFYFTLSPLHIISYYFKL
jgi:ariadne-1